jgi:hypothetical protein
MICPQTKAECKNLAFCDMTGKCLEHEADLLTPTPPTLAEIERLMDALVDAAIYSDVPDAQEAKAALMAAIRLYVQE